MNAIILAICLLLAHFHPARSSSKSSSESKESDEKCCKDTSKEHKCHCHDEKPTHKDLKTMKSIVYKAMQRVKDGRLEIPKDPQKDSLYMQFENYMLGRKTPPKEEQKKKSTSSSESKEHSKTEESTKNSSSSKDSRSKSSSESKETEKSSKSNSKEDKRTFYGVGGTIAVGFRPPQPAPSSPSSETKSSKESASKSRSSTESRESKSKGSSETKESGSKESKSKKSSESKESKSSKSSDSSETKESRSSSISDDSRSKKSSSSEDSASSRESKSKSGDSKSSKDLGGVQGIAVNTRVRYRESPEDPLDDVLEGYYSTKSEHVLEPRISSQSVLSSMISVRILSIYTNTVCPQ